MFEISILCVIAIAAAYSATLWLMGRRKDVLHGEFVKAEPAPEMRRLELPARPAVVAIPKLVPKAALPNPDLLNSLLEAIKRDLKDAAYGKPAQSI